MCYKFLFRKRVVVDAERVEIHSDLLFFVAALKIQCILQLLLCICCRRNSVRCCSVFFVIFTDCTDNTVKVFMYHMTEIFIFLNLCELQCSDVQIVFVGAFLHCRIPHNTENGIQIVDSHISNAVNIDFNIGQKSSEILVSCNFTK